jgi:hypothetical protein
VGFVYLFLLGAVLQTIRARWPATQQYLPPFCPYLSARKRRAMRLAVAEFRRRYSVPINVLDSGVYQIDSATCYVLVSHGVKCRHRPATLFAVSDGNNQAEEVRTTTFPSWTTVDMYVQWDREGRQEAAAERKRPISN